MDKLKIAALLAAAGIGVAACGGGSSHSAQTQHPSDIASAIPGASGFHSEDPTLYAREEGNADLNGDSLDIVTFANSQAEHNWLDVASQFGGGIIVHGDGWAVVTANETNARVIMKALGGSEN